MNTETPKAQELIYTQSVTKNLNCFPYASLTVISRPSDNSFYLKLNKTTVKS